jgi:large subunit ribosomal protein L15
MPLIRRIPKRGFHHGAFARRYAPVNLQALEGLAEEVVDEAVLRRAGLVKGRWDGVKILGGGEIHRKVVVRVSAVSEAARRKIEAAGGKVELLSLKKQEARHIREKAGPACG